MKLVTAKVAFAVGPKIFCKLKRTNWVLAWLAMDAAVMSMSLQMILLRCLLGLDPGALP